jgi:hypothetical protein
LSVPNLSVFQKHWSEVFLHFIAPELSDPSQTFHSPSLHTQQAKMASDKAQIMTADFEVDDVRTQKKLRTLRRFDGTLQAMSTLALFMALTVMGVSADILAVYNTTHATTNFPLSLWPTSFNLRPNVALLVGSTVVFLANWLSLVACKVRSARVYWWQRELEHSNL